MTYLNQHLKVCIERQLETSGNKVCRLIKVTNESREIFVENNFKDEPLDISENINSVTGEFITGDF